MSKKCLTGWFAAMAHGERVQHFYLSGTSAFPHIRHSLCGKRYHSVTNIGSESQIGRHEPKCKTCEKRVNSQTEGG